MTLAMSRAIHGRYISRAVVTLAELLSITTASVVQWSEFLATDTEVPGSIPGATRFF